MTTIPEKKFSFEIENGNGLRQRFVAYGFPFDSTKEEDKVRVEFVLNSHNITVPYPSANSSRELPDLDITQKWNARTEISMLWLNGEEWTNSQISQIAVDSLFSSNINY